MSKDAEQPIGDDWLLATGYWPPLFGAGLIYLAHGSTMSAHSPSLKAEVSALWAEGGNNAV